ncbi:MAG: DNA mismatch endonuclease Vsr [Bacteroidaceae bacterium]|nr:DNA mismatch endonuclease Vsr [Bacteroidaceae bacterium]
MSDTLSPQQRHECMSHIHSTSTKPEIRLRKELWRNGFRYRKNDKRLPGSPDIVLPKYRTVVFIHGCFWHGHKDCKKYVVPKTNTDFWIEKVERNQKRDEDVWRQLEAKGWSVVIVWECELEKKRFDDTVNRVESDIISNGDSYRRYKEERRINREEWLEERRSHQRETESLLNEIKHL